MHPLLPNNLSRRWKAQDRKTEVLARGVAAAGAGLGGFTVNVQHKGGSTMSGQYGVTLEDRMRWAQLADTLSSHNIYTVSFLFHLSNRFSKSVSE